MVVPQSHSTTPDARLTVSTTSQFEKVTPTSSVSTTNAAPIPTSMRPNELCCTLINARSLKNKIPDIQDFLKFNNFDVVFVTETWLNETITSSVLTADTGYRLFRKVRPAGTVGGVTAFLSNDYECIQVALTNKFDTLELLCFDVFSAHVKYRFIVFYRPPNSSQSYLQMFLMPMITCLELMHPSFWLEILIYR